MYVCMYEISKMPPSWPWFGEDVRFECAILDLKCLASTPNFQPVGWILVCLHRVELSIDKGIADCHVQQLPQKFFVHAHCLLKSHTLYP